MKAAEQYPMVLTPVRGKDEVHHDLFREFGFHLRSTVQSTTLLFDPAADIYIKILHRLRVRQRILGVVRHRARELFRRAAALREKGVPVSPVVAYGAFRGGRIPFIAVQRASGQSVYDSAVRSGQRLSPRTWREIAETIARVHLLGFWFGDAHLSHLFVEGEVVTGIIDIDGIRRNLLFRQRHFAKDLAGFCHPAAFMEGEERSRFLGWYMETAGVRNTDKFLARVDRFGERRWGR